MIDDLVRFSKGKIDAVCGIESRGYLFGIAIAVALEVPFILIRKAGKLPPPVIAESYDLVTKNNEASFDQYSVSYNIESNTYTIKLNSCVTSNDFTFKSLSTNSGFKSKVE